MALAGGLTRLTPLPPLGGKKKRKSRLDYSIDLEAQRAKRPRVSIEELSERGAEVLRERVGDLRDVDKRGVVTRVLDVLDVDRNLIANAVVKALNLRVQPERRGTLAPKVWWSDILGALGLPKGAVRSVLGLAADVAFSPLTWVTLGGGAGIKLARHLPRAVGPLAGMLKTAAKTGRAAPELAGALGLKKGLPAVFARLAREKGPQAARKMLLGRGGGMLTRRLAKRATFGKPEALNLILKHGEKGRPLMRLPGMKKGIAELPFGTRARKYRAAAEAVMPEGKEALKEFAARHGVKLGAGRRAMLAVKSAATASKAVTTAESAHAMAVKRLAAANARYRAYLLAERTSGIGKIARPLVRTSAVRKAQRELEIAREIHRQTKEHLSAARSAAGLTKKYEVSPEALRLMRAATARTTLQAGRARPSVPTAQEAGTLLKRAKAGMRAEAATAPRVTQYPIERLRFRTPVQLATGEAAAKAAAMKEARAVASQAAERAASTQAKAARAAQQLERFATSPRAPGVVRELKRAEMGATVVPQAPGALNLLRRAKRQMFGPGPSETWQQMLGTRARYTTVAAREMLTAKGRVLRRLEPAIAEISAKTGTKADQVRALVFHVADAGPGGKLLAEYPTFDPIHGLYRQAQQLGITDHPKVKAALQDVFGLMEKYRRAEAGRGIALGEVPGYAGQRVYTPQARAQLGMQAAAGNIPPGAKPGGKMSVIQPPTLGRARWLLYKTPEGKIERVLSTGRRREAQIAALTEAGAKPAGVEPISVAQWNKWMQAAPDTRPAILGEDIPGARKFRGEMFRTDLAESVAARAASHQKMQAAADMRDLLRPYGTVRAEGAAATHRFAHLVKPPRPKGKHPFSVLEATGLWDRWYPEPIADMINRMTEVWERPEAIEKLLTGSDRVLGFWKSFQLYHPAYILRNVFQNFFGGLMAGANPLAVSRLVPRPETQLLRQAMLTRNPTALGGRAFRLAGHDWPLERLYQEGASWDLVGTGRTAMETPATFAGRTGLGQAAATGRRGWQAVHGAVFKANSAVEDTQRLATWLHFIDTGMDPKSAAMRTFLAMPDLSDLAMWERQGLARIFPWWRWMRKNGALQLFVYLPQKPAYAAMLPRLRHVTEGTLPWLTGKVPEQLRPEWMQEQVGTQITGGAEAGAVFLPQTWFPFEELYSVIGLPIEPGESFRRWVSALRPELKFGVEAATGVSTFKRTPLEPLGAGGLRGLGRAFAGRSGTAADALLGLRSVREWAPGGRVSEMPTLGGKLQRVMLGGAIQPVDYQRGLQARYYELDRLQRQLRGQYNRALQAGDQSLAQSLLRQWVQVMKQMYQWKLPISRGAEEMMAGAGVARTGPP